MIYDFYAELAQQQARPPRKPPPGGLASGFVDECTVWSTRGDGQKNEARGCYIKHAPASLLDLPAELLLIPNFTTSLNGNWLGVEVSFVLGTPWYSKDDRPFHVLDNPVRKDRVLGVPYMAATSWKGMLRWAFRMTTRLIGPNPEKDHDKIKAARAGEVHLFGNEKGENKDFFQGALVFYPTWFNKIGFEVINPHSRERRAGTQPIYYEVVPPQACGTLYLLYAPWPGMKEPKGLDRKQAIQNLLEAIEQLLTIYGISAKRTVGWGTAKIKLWKAYRKGNGQVSAESSADLWANVQAWLNSGETP